MISVAVTSHDHELLRFYSHHFEGEHYVDIRHGSIIALPYRPAGNSNIERELRDKLLFLNMTMHVEGGKSHHPIFSQGKASKFLTKKFFTNGQNRFFFSGYPLPAAITGSPRGIAFKFFSSSVDIFTNTLVTEEISC